MKLEKRLKWVCGKEITKEENCKEGFRCTQCYDKLVAWCEIDSMIKALKKISESQYNADAKDIANETLDRLRKNGQI